MPKYFEFVFSAYFIWGAVFAIYLLILFRRSRRNRAALEKLSRQPSPVDGRS